MADRPILFSGPMVRVTLDGTKRQTRRLVNPQPCKDPHGHGWQWHGGLPLVRVGFGAPYVHTDKPSMMSAMLKAAPYAVGDRLWGRETFRVAEDVGEGWTELSGRGDLHVIYDADGARDYLSFPDGYRWPNNAKVVHHNADTPEHWISYGPIPSIFMPRWASRITLEVTRVRVERLQDISEEDAIAEGIKRYVGPLRWVRYLDAITGEPIHNTARDAFQSLWANINGQASWVANPWVWVYDFTRPA